MGRRKAIYQSFAPNPSQDYSVRGQVPHKVPTRDGKGAVGSLPQTACRAALPAGLSGGAAALPCCWRRLLAGPPQGTWGLGRCPSWFGWNTRQRRVLLEEKRAHSVNRARACPFGRSAISQQKGSREGTALLAPTATGRPLFHRHSGLIPSSWKTPVCGEDSADARVWSWLGQDQLSGVGASRVPLEPTLRSQGRACTCSAFPLAPHLPFSQRLLWPPSPA